MKKVISILLSVAIIISLAVVSFATTDIGNVAVYSQNSMNFEGSGHIIGDGIIVNGTISGNNNPWATGSIYKTNNVVYDKPKNYDGNDSKIKNYDGNILSFTEKETNEFPRVAFFQSKNTLYKDGTKDLTVGWGSNDETDGYTITEDCFIRNLDVKNTLTLNISTPDNGVRIIRVLKFFNKGNIKVTGTGKVIIYIDEDFSPANGGTINATGGNFGSSDKVTLVFGNIDNIKIDGYIIAANIVALQSNIDINNTIIKGNIYTNNDFEMTNSGSVTGLVYAPFSNTELKNGCYIKGMLYTNSLKLSGSCYVEKGEYTGLPAQITNIIGNIKDDVLGEGNTGGDTSSNNDTSSNDNSSSISSNTSSEGDEEDPPASDEVTIKVTISRRMSIRLQDGIILKNGDTFKMKKYSTIRFQMCTNNWDTNTYTDDGQGIAGTKVFEFTNLPNKELYLRVDNDRHFKPVRFHFIKGDFEKLTGVDNVLSIPLESLSINFPLGSTITVKAYVKGQVVEIKDIFVSSDIDFVDWQY